MTLHDSTARTPATQLLSWRAATATRVFALAIAVGQALGSGSVSNWGVTVVAVFVLGAVASLLDWQATPQLSRLIPILEGIVVATLLATNAGVTRPLLVYLAAPVLIGGIRGGWVTTTNAFLASVLTTTTLAFAPQSPLAAEQLRQALTWLTVGLGAGLLAAVQTRSIRRLQEAQAPYLAAHRLMTQLHRLSQELVTGLDAEGAAEMLLRDVMSRGAAERASVFVLDPSRRLVHLSGDQPGTLPDAELIAVAQAAAAGESPAEPWAAQQIEVGDHVVGVVVARRRSEALPGALGESLAAAVERHGVPLDTALLFDDVRTLATAEERQRLARDIHDGVAQDIASLGYAIDELAASSTDPQVIDAATSLRTEVTRVVGELRHSVFDLRTGGTWTPDWTNTLRAYVDGACERQGLLPHLKIEETASALPLRVQSELLWIIQEALANIRKHVPAAENLWLELSVTDTGFSLMLSNDGDRPVVPQGRRGHYGLDTMRERARKIHAVLEFTGRSGGGSVMTVRSASSTRSADPVRPDLSGVTHP